MRSVLVGLGVVGAGFLMVGCQAEPTVGAANGAAMVNQADRASVGRVLDGLHDAAARADETRYFALFAPEAVFLGTDATERWTLEQFRAYAHPIFSQGRGWTYIVQERFVGFGPGGRTAWFDESLTNAKLGLCRGSGALVKGDDGEWRIVQYNLTIPVPNDLAEEVVKMIRAKSGDGATAK